MADVDFEVPNTIIAEKESSKDFFDAVKDDVGQKVTKPYENNSKEEEMEEEKIETELLIKIDKAIGLPLESNGNSDQNNQEIDKNQKDGEDLLKEDEILDSDELLETIIDEKMENDLLNIEEEDEVPPSVAENEFIELFNSVTIPTKEKESNDNIFDSLCEEKKSVENPEDAGLLDECESPKEKNHDDDTSNGNGSNDEDSIQNGGESAEEAASEQENEISEKESKDSKSNDDDDDEDCKKEEQEEISNTASTTNEHEDIPIKIDEVQNESDKIVNDDDDEDEKSEEVKKNNEVLIIKDVVSTSTEVFEATPTESTEDVSENIKMTVDDEPSSPKQSNDLNNSEDIEMAEDEKEVQNEEVDVKPSIEDLQVKNEEKDTESETESKKEIIKKKEKTENEISLQQVKFNFIKKFASKFGKLSHDDLEELLLEKITESLVYRSQCAELRTKYEEQEETIERLQKRLSVVTKQYNDLDMIHKRVEKDLKERPDQPIQPVRITRAVGLQVFLEPKNSAYNNSGTVVSNANVATRAKQMTNSSTTPTLAASILNHKTAACIKRLNDSNNIKITCEPEPKRKKIITPLRPSLTEKEETSIKLQEANIEQHIRAKIHKTTNTVTKYQSAIPTVATNGIVNKSLPKQSTSSSTSIDLTDDVDDDVPSKTTHPPALVAIQRSLNNSNSQHPRALINKPGSVRSLNVAYRNEPLKQLITSHKHPAPLPQTPPQVVLPNTKKIPPRPNIKINNVANGIIVSWTVDGLTAEHAEIQCYQIYAYEETKLAPSTENWKHVGDVKALLLPMAVTLTQFQEGQKYFFAVRAMDANKRLGQFSIPKTWA